ncbi:hypothetical protein HanRHA438_Chr04g0200171 [Helianthus annuus]|nr:hypothetical protein HanRHA438_Chr04g0200171 [Helianthus annuus]
MKAKTGSQQRTHNKQLFTISFPLDCGSNICYTSKYCFYQHLLTYNSCSIQGLMKTKPCCSICCLESSTADHDKYCWDHSSGRMQQQFMFVLCNVMHISS